MCLNVKVFDAIAEHGRGVTLEQARELLRAVDPSSVTSAVHRLSSNGALTLKRMGGAIIYCAKPGARPEDKRGRPRIAATQRSDAAG